MKITIKPVNLDYKAEMLKIVAKEDIRLIGMDYYRYHMPTSINQHTTIVEGKIEKEGEAVVDFEVFKKLPLKQELTLELVGTELHITSPTFNFKLPIRYQDFEIPIWEVKSQESILTIDAKELNKMIKEVIYAWNKKEASYPGVLFEFDEVFSVAATDGKQLAVRRSNLKPKYKFKANVCPITLKMLKNFKGKVDIFVDDNFIAFVNGNVKVIGVLEFTDFPIYKAVIPDEYVISFKVKRKELLEAIEKINEFPHTRYEDIVFWEIREEELELKNNNVSITLKKSKTPTTNTVFNSKFLEKMLSSIDTEEIEISLSEWDFGCVLKISFDNFLYLLMPVRIND
jgi:DNA polymerase-3 subunit beta